MIRYIDLIGIKGFGFVVVNLFYFIYLMLVLLFNIVIVNGYNVLIGVKVKLGCWDYYLVMW